MRVGIAHHFGWAVAVTATPEFEVVDRRRIELIEPGLPAAPIHHEGGTHEMHSSGELLNDADLAALVANVRESVVRMAGASLGELAASLPGPITSLAIRGWPSGFPEDIATKRRPPYESRADSVMYCKVLSEVAAERSWDIRTYNSKTVESDAVAILGTRAKEILYGPRSAIGPPWSKDHRIRWQQQSSRTEGQPGRTIRVGASHPTGDQEQGRQRFTCEIRRPSGRRPHE